MMRAFLFWLTGMRRKCRHPAVFLAVRAEPETVVADADFEHVTYRLRCRSCGGDVDIRHARCRGGVEAFLARGRKQ